MKLLNLPYTDHEEEHLSRIPRYHTALLGVGGVSNWLSGDVIVSTEGFPVLLRMDARPKDMLHIEALYKYAIQHTFNKSGVRRYNSGATYAAEVFGTSQKSEIRKRMATARTRFSYNHASFADCAEVLVERGWDKVRKHCPDMYDAIDSAPKALDCWRLRGTPYTSGVINASVTMPYHRDRGNVPSTGSVMWVSRKLVTGGHLHIPELNALVDCKHGTLLVFYGEIFWHGVTLIRGLSRSQAGRFSLVAYAKNSILSAQDPETEHKLAALRGTLSADDRRDTVLKYE